MKSVSLIKLAFLAGCALLSFDGVANAHGGHVGELAGHSHWIGLGAVAVAAGIAALLAKSKSGNKETAQSEDEAAENANGISGETAESGSAG